MSFLLKKEHRLTEKYYLEIKARLSQTFSCKLSEFKVYKVKLKTVVSN